MHPAPPTPQAPTPRPSRLSTVLCSLLAVVIVFVFVGLSLPVLLTSRKDEDFTEALSNARQVGLALSAFEVEYGRFPDAETAADVAERTGSTIAPPGDTANAYFRQLLAAGIANSEQIFYAKTAFTQRPDNIFITQESAPAPVLTNGPTCTLYRRRGRETAVFARATSAPPPFSRTGLRARFTVGAVVRLRSSRGRRPPRPRSHERAYVGSEIREQIELR